ncbi:restriction endonuclease subunit S [Yersinia enterocolitica]|uniref:restriction endonuclease subunit S n=1 Tax=Yersinia enterocolitica TaxID=630 RepID=UPI003AB2CF4D
MSIDSRVPEIRFKGFSEEWQEREFSDIATRVSIHHQSTCLPWVEYEDIVAGKGRFNKDIHQKKTFKAGLKFEADDVLFGKLRPYLKNWFLADFEGLAVGDFWVLRADNVASTFLFSLIQTNEFEFISNLSAGSKMPRSDWGLVSSSCFFVPKNISESNEIGNYFQKLDSLINQYQQKHDKFSNIKKAMLEKMFPKPGETIPEIRFKGFSGEWEEKGLNNEVELFSGLTYSPSDIRNSGTLVLRSSNVKNGQLIEADNIYVNPEVVNCSNVVEGDIIVVVRNGSRSLIGKHAQVTSRMNNTVIGAFMTGIRSKQPAFINALLDTNMFTTEVEKNLGATINQITNGSFNSMVFMFPKEDEQTAIGNYFQKLDALINQHQQQIAKLNNIKQACLSKMFV